MICSDKLKKNSHISPIFYKKYTCTVHDTKPIKELDEITIDIVNVPKMYLTNDTTFNTYLAKYYHDYHNCANYKYNKYNSFSKTIVL